MSKLRWLIPLVLLALLQMPAQANSWPKNSAELAEVNAKLEGVVVDHTANHGQDNRIWSRSLGQRRDLYVYLPPGFDPHQRYPIMIWLHGVGQDEQCFLRCVVRYIDRAIMAGELPQMIVAAPDGSLSGEPAAMSGSFFLNSDAGEFEDWVIFDVWDHLCTHYPIRSERETHILAGWSMGGYGAYYLGIKHRNHFGVVAGISPALNLRWMGKDGHYFTNFDPHLWDWRTTVSPRDIIGVFPFSGTVVHLTDWFKQLFPLSPNPVWDLSMINPIEMVDRLGLREGDLKMFVAYGGKDEFNLDAQVESFLYLCKWRRLTIYVDYDPEGHHNILCLKHFVPSMLSWLGAQLLPFCSNHHEEALVGGAFAGMCCDPWACGAPLMCGITSPPAEPVTAAQPPVQAGPTATSGFLRHGPLRHFLPPPTRQASDPGRATDTSPTGTRPSGACSEGQCPSWLPPVNPAVRSRPR